MINTQFISPDKTYLQMKHEYARAESVGVHTDQVGKEAVYYHTHWACPTHRTNRHIWLLQINDEM